MSKYTSEARGPLRALKHDISHGNGIPCDCGNMLEGVRSSAKIHRALDFRIHNFFQVGWRAHIVKTVDGDEETEVNARSNVAFPCGEMMRMAEGDQCHACEHGASNHGSCLFAIILLTLC